MTGKSLPRATTVFGELGLGSELRAVHHARRRMAEAGRIGMTSVIVPRKEAISHERSAVSQKKTELTADR